MDARTTAMDGLLPLLPRARRALVTLLLLTAGLLACASGADAARGGRPGPPAHAVPRAVEPVGDPSERWPDDGPAIQAALAIAIDQWGFAPCHGAVEIGWWDELDRALDAQATWANDAGAYAAPLSNTSCEIALNPWGQWDWPKLCTILVHEVGHLDGHDHVDDEEDVMYGTYVRTLPACAAAPEPPEGAAPAAVPASASAAHATRPSSATKRPTARATTSRSRTSRTHGKLRPARAKRAHARAPVKRHVTRRS